MVELAATLTSWLSMVTDAVGVTVSTVKLPVSAAGRGVAVDLGAGLMSTGPIGGADVGAGVRGER